MQPIPSTFKATWAFQNRTMAYFHSQIAQQQRILQLTQSVLPDNLAKQIRHCLIRDDKLLIYTDTAAWATQLRFYNTMLLSAMGSLTRPPIKQVKIRLITRPTGRVLTPQRKANIPSVANIENIRNHSETISDEPLSMALLNLSKTLQKFSARS